MDINKYLTQYAYLKYSDLIKVFNGDKVKLKNTVEKMSNETGTVVFWNSLSKEEMISTLEGVLDTYKDIDTVVEKVTDSFEEDMVEFSATVMLRKLKDKVVSYEFDHTEAADWLEEFRTVYLRRSRQSSDAPVTAEEAH